MKTIMFSTLAIMFLAIIIFIQGCTLDVFEVSNAVAGLSAYHEARREREAREQSFYLSGTLKLVGQDGQFLGYINVISYDTKSFLNEYGIYGSKYSSTSIWNPYSQYGSRYSNLSAFNPYATQPPMIYNEQVFIAYLTMNKYLYPAITPLQLLQILAGE